MANLLKDYTLDELNTELDMGREWYAKGKFYTDEERTENLTNTYQASMPDCDIDSWIESDERFISIENVVYEREENGEA